MISRERYGPLIDAALAVGVTALMVLAAAASGERPARPVDGVTVGILAAVGAWAAAARHAPRTALIGAALGYFAAMTLDVPGFSPAPAVGVQLFTTALAGYRWWALGTAGALVVLELPARIFGTGPETPVEAAADLVEHGALLALLPLLAELIRGRRALREGTARRLEAAERERRRRTAAERLRTARDLHDVLAHTVTVIGIHAGVAAHSIDDRPAEAKEAIERVRAANREAMRDLRSTIRVLRDSPGGREPEPPPGLTGLDDLVASARAAGVDAVLEMRGNIGALRPAAALTAYRVAQEAVTNALRHSGAASLRVEVSVEEDALLVAVSDDGAGASAADRPSEGSGSGLPGMAERVGALDGELAYGPGDGGRGWSVRARIPHPERPG
ncbi:sensor histidine kinase [Nocardiopsis composta]|uniref:histidine kinase n=1 Tax=Nocardiopsis composta TaxID=157465 RepID=A0A7W8VE34_9ACTN|nr:histidine kinase [Nocardiopsis composta]MBB5432519.1 signal transduction histidine kinase [Nocardiopsis composta]